MHAMLTKIGMKLVRGACAAAFATAMAAVGCGGTLRADVTSLSDEEVELTTIRAALSQGKDYVDAITAGRAARRAAVARRAAAAAGQAAQASQ